MKRALLNVAIVVAILLFLAANYIATGERSMRGYQAPGDEVYAAALKAIEMRGHSVRAKSQETRPSEQWSPSLYRVDFQLRMIPFGGYGAKLHIHGRSYGDSEYSNVTVTPAGFPGDFLYAFAGGRQEIRRVFAQMDAEICATDKSKCPSKPPR